MPFIFHLHAPKTTSVAWHGDAVPGFVAGLGRALGLIYACIARLRTASPAKSTRGDPFLPAGPLPPHFLPLSPFPSPHIVPHQPRASGGFHIEECFLKKPCPPPHHTARAASSPSPGMGGMEKDRSPSRIDAGVQRGRVYYLTEGVRRGPPPYLSSTNKKMTFVSALCPPSPLPPRTLCGEWSPMLPVSTRAVVACTFIIWCQGKTGRRPPRRRQ